MNTINMDITPDQSFCEHLSFAVIQLAERFPENAHFIFLKTSLPLLSFNNGLRSLLRKTWMEMTINNIDDIMNKKEQEVYNLFSNADEQVKNMLIHQYITDPNVETETKDNIWLHIQTLTFIAHLGFPSEIQSLPQFHLSSSSSSSSTTTNTNNITNSTPSTTTNATPMENIFQNMLSQGLGGLPTGNLPNLPFGDNNKPGATGKPPGLQDTAKTILDAIPKLSEMFNKMVADDSPDNYIGQIVRQFVNPDQLQNGLAANLTAGLLQKDQSVMQAVQNEVGSLSAEDVVKKLQKLQKYEELEKKRKTGKKI